MKKHFYLFAAMLMALMSLSLTACGDEVTSLRKAAEQGDAGAQYNLGVCYEAGRDVAQDYREAVKWYRMAAEQGHAGAQCQLGLCYYNGSGVAQDDREAVKWWRKAAEQGDAKAKEKLEMMGY